MLVVKHLFHNLCFCFFLLSGHFARSAMQMKRLKVSSSDYKYTDDSLLLLLLLFFQLFVLLLLITFLVFFSR